MKLFRPILFLVACLVALTAGLLSATPALTFAAMGFMLWLVGNALGSPRGQLNATLSVNEILQDTLDAFKIQVPMLMNGFSTDFSSNTAKKDDQIISHIRTLPSVQSYDATSGYELNQVEADALLTDVTVTLDRLRHVPVRVKYLTQLASKKNLYREAIADQAYVLAKSVVDYALTLAVEANFSYDRVESVANTTFDTLEKLRTDLNGQAAIQRGRFGIVNSAVAQAIQLDSRVGSTDYFGQLNGASGYRTFKNVSGFENIWEYPDLPANSINLSGFFGDKRAIHVASRIPSNDSEMAAILNLPPKAKFEVVTDPDTGLSLLGIYWQKDGTFDVWCTVALLYGITAGAQGGGANAKCDKAGIKLVTA